MYSGLFFSRDLCISYLTFYGVKGMDIKTTSILSYTVGILVFFLLAIIEGRAEGEPIENWDQGRWATCIIFGVCWLPIGTFYLLWCILPVFKFLIKERK